MVLCLFFSPKKVIWLKKIVLLLTIHNETLQASNRLIINQQAILPNLSNQLLAEILVIIVVLCIGWNTLQNVLGSLSAVAMTVHLADVTSINTVDKADNQRFATHGTIGGKCCYIEHLFKVVGFLRFY